MKSKFKSEKSKKHESNVAFKRKREKNIKIDMCVKWLCLLNLANVLVDIAYTIAL